MVTITHLLAFISTPEC